MPKYDTYYTDGGEEVQAYRVDEAHEVNTIAGVRQANPGEYVVARDRAELVDVFPADVFEQDHSTDEPDEDDTGEASDLPDEDSDDFDPTQHTVAEVQDYIKTHPDERDAVLARERNGANRSTIVG